MSENMEKRVCFWAAACVPFIPMLFLYGNGTNSQYLALWQILSISALFAGGTLLLFLLVKKCLGHYVALATCILTWFIFLSYETIYRMLPLRHRELFPITLAALAVCVGVIRLAFKKLKIQKISLVLSLAIFILFAMNVGIAGWKWIMVNAKDSAEDSRYKVSFTIDQNLPTPNIYWLHCDGMLGFDAMEKYFSDPQQEFALELENRGFMINRSAQFEAHHSTQTAIPVLMSPHYYDTTLYNYLQNKASPKFAELLEARQKNELVKAFVEKGYTTATLASLSFYFFPETDYFFTTDGREMTFGEDKSNEIIALDQAENLLFLLAELTPIDMLGLENIILIAGLKNTVLEKWIADTRWIMKEDNSPARTDTFNTILAEYIQHTQEPRFMLAAFNLAHRPFIFDEKGTANPENSDDIMRYPAHHSYTRDKLLEVVDTILHNDPDAVIVLQADHGLHGLSSDEILDVLHEEDAVKEIWNGVMSAVRIPEKYEAPEEPLNPVNIARYLINQYVGQSYEYRISDGNDLY